MFLLYPFVTDSEGITTHPFGQPIKFKFIRSPEPREISTLQDVCVTYIYIYIYVVLTTKKGTYSGVCETPL